MGAARRRSSKFSLLPVLFSKAARRLLRSFKRYQIPISSKLIKYPKLNLFRYQKHRGAWFFGSCGSSEMADRWRKLFADEEEVIAAADDICEHIFDLLGSGKTHLGRKISWNSDFKSGKSWPTHIIFSGKEINAPGGHSDIKVPWELSRFQHLVTLGRAYMLSGDEKYTREFVEQVNSWIENNSWGRGPNWACTMDVAIRVANWAMAYHFFEGSELFDDISCTRMLKSMWEHGWFIVRNLERGAVNGNHLVSDLAGLFVVGVFFQGSRTGRKWRDLALNSLFDEMRAQVLEDGVDYEKSISYHRLVLELFTYSFRLAEINGMKIPSDIRRRWERMFEFTAAYTRPDGTAPQIGDTDDGMFYKLSTPKCSLDEYYSSFLDHRYLLSIGAMIFDRADFAHASGKLSEEVFWTFDGDSYDHFDELLKSIAQEPESRAFEAAGFYVIRSGSQHAVIDAGDNGMLGLGAHAHNDTLSFELFAVGNPFIIDPGTYLYTADPLWRNRFRSTAYHNTVMVDGQEIHPMPPRWLFGLPDAGHVKVLRWDVDGDELVLEAEHDAYCRLKEPVTHRRKISFNKANSLWRIDDSFQGSGEHKFESRLHFAHGIDLIPDVANVSCIAAATNGTKFKVLVSSQSAIKMSIEDGWYSPAYGRRVPIRVANYSWQSEVPCRFGVSVGLQ